MSSSEFGREVSEINENSTVCELIGFLMSSFQRKEFKLVEGILIKREEVLKTQLQKEQQDSSLLVKIHCDSQLKILEMEDDMKRLKDDNLKLREELKKLRREKLENAQKFLEYEERITNLEKAVANVVTVDVGIQADTCDPFNNDLRKEGMICRAKSNLSLLLSLNLSAILSLCQNSDIQKKKRKRSILDNSNLGCKQTAENATNHHEYAQASYGVQSPPDGPWFGSNSSHQEKKSCNDGAFEIRKDLPDGHRNAQIGIEDARDTPKVGIDGLKQENENDSSYAADAKPINRTRDRPQSPILIEIIESDDEASGGEKPFIVNTCSSEVNSSKKGVTFMESGSKGPTQDKSRENVRSNPLDNFLPKRKRSLTDTDDNQMVKERCQGLQLASRKLSFCASDDSSDCSSSDSEDECSESVINMMIESLRQDCRKSQKTWNFASDMQSEFLTNNELCMNAICALYRKEISTEKSINYTSPINLDLFNAMGGRDLAEYLIDGDPEYKLKRTVLEVQQKDSTLLDRCKELAGKYIETLFEIYRKNEDPFFPPRS